MNVGQRIRRDAKLLADDPEVAALHRCLTEHLFDARLDKTFLAKASGATREVRERLVARLGPLKVYVSELRMVEAEKLVRGGKVPIAQIGARVGYPVARTFRRAFSI